MAKLVDGNVTIMYDVKENVVAAFAAMQAAGVNVKVVEE